MLDPFGWIPWEPETDPLNTTFYAEYQNFGPGSAIDKRAGWLGVLPNITYDEAAKFTVEPFIQGRQWLVQANVFFQGTLRSRLRDAYSMTSGFSSSYSSLPTFLLCLF